MSEPITNTAVIFDWLNRASPLVLMVGLIYATIWANNLTNSINTQQAAINSHLLEGAHTGANDRITVLETHLTYMRADLLEIKELLNKANSK